MPYPLILIILPALIHLVLVVSAIYSYIQGHESARKIASVLAIITGVLGGLWIFSGDIVSPVFSIIFSIACYRLANKENYRLVRQRKMRNRHSTHKST